MEKKQIIAIIGLRRVGKTILMKQTIKHIIKNVKFNENIFYFLFDELMSQKPETLEEILDYYLKTIAKEGKKYIFLDEIQKVPYWQDIIKRFYDTMNDVKFIVSGSSIRIKKSKESLAGRIYDIYIPILSFREFLELNGIFIEDIRPKELEKTYEANIHKKPIFEKYFMEYIFKGSFPEMVKETDQSIIKNYIKSSVIEKIILEDIPTVFEVKKKDVLSAIMEYCSKETSNLLDLTKLSRILNVNYQTVKSYIFYLKNSFVIDLLYNYSESIAKQLRKNKKVHIIHPSVSITMMGYSKEILNVEEILGRYVETIIFQHSKLLSERVFFWRSPQKEEVDIILDFNPPLPIEVKFKNKLDLSDVENLIKFMKKN